MKTNKCFALFILTSLSITLGYCCFVACFFIQYRFFSENFILFKWVIPFILTVLIFCLNLKITKKAAGGLIIFILTLGHFNFAVSLLDSALSPRLTLNKVNQINPDKWARFYHIKAYEIDSEKAQYNYMKRKKSSRHGFVNYAMEVFVTVPFREVSRTSSDKRHIYYGLYLNGDTGDYRNFSDALDAENRIIDHWKAMIKRDFNTRFQYFQRVSERDQLEHFSILLPEPPPVPGSPIILIPQLTSFNDQVLRDAIFYIIYSLIYAALTYLYVLSFLDPDRLDRSVK